MAFSNPLWSKTLPHWPMCPEPDLLSVHSGRSDKKLKELQKMNCEVFNLLHPTIFFLFSLSLSLSLYFSFFLSFSFFFFFFFFCKKGSFTASISGFGRFPRGVQSRNFGESCFRVLSLVHPILFLRQLVSWRQNGWIWDLIKNKSFLTVSYLQTPVAALTKKKKKKKRKIKRKRKKEKKKKEKQKKKKKKKKQKKKFFL